MPESVSEGLAPVYRRELPGGGYVAISVTRLKEVSRTQVSVKRRAAGERDAGETLVIAEGERHAGKVGGPAGGGGENRPNFARDLTRAPPKTAPPPRALPKKRGLPP